MFIIMVMFITPHQNKELNAQGLIHRGFCVSRGGDLASQACVCVCVSDIVNEPQFSRRGEQTVQPGQWEELTFPATASVNKLPLCYCTIQNTPSPLDASYPCGSRQTKKRKSENQGMPTKEIGLFTGYFEHVCLMCHSLPVNNV